MNPYTPKNSRRQFAICTPIGTTQVRVEGNAIVGQWQETLTEFSGFKGRLLVEDFLNWSPEPEQIARFTAMYAPLGAPYPKVSIPAPGKPFQFSFDLWRSVQTYFQETWIFAAGSDHARFRFSSADYLEIRGRELVYNAGSLEGFMRMELLTAPLDRLRYCEHPDCTTPYFVATHMKQQYCSPPCAAWGQAQSKKGWWQKRGPQWLNNRKKNLKKVESKQRSVGRKKQ